MASAPARSAIAVTGLRKSFGDNVVLDGVDLDVREGTTFSLLGPNGAGKTTVVKILSTLIGFDGGEVTRDVRNRSATAATSLSRPNSELGSCRTPRRITGASLSNNSRYTPCSAG